MERRASVFKKKETKKKRKKREKSASPSGGFEAGSVHRWMGYIIGSAEALPILCVRYNR